VISKSPEGAMRLSAPHADDQGHAYQLLDTMGTASNNFTNRAISHLANSIGDQPHECDGESLGSALALIAAIAPQNELEAALAVQMAATHELAMRAANRAKHAQVRPAMNDYGNMLNKTARTFAAQMEALTKLRRGGEQVVRHVHVYEGGQAVVAGTVNVGGRDVGKVSEQPHALPPVPAVLGADPLGHALPSAGHAEWTVPDARGQVPRRAEGQQE
jgi:hypothetical protein